MSHQPWSSAPAVLADLAQRLPRRPGLSGVEVFTAPPGQRPEEGVVFVGVDGDQEWAGLGRDKRDERYDVVGVVSIVGPGTDEEAATTVRDRAYAIVAEIEDELRGDPTLGVANPDLGKVVVTIEVKGHDLDQGATDKDRWVALHFRLHVHARI